MALNFFKEGAQFETDDNSNCWILIELSRNFALPHGFSFTHGHQSIFYNLVNWKVEISQDKTQWHCIGTYSDTVFLKKINFLLL